MKSLFILNKLPVLLLIFILGLSLFSCKKQNTPIPFPMNYISKMAGKHNWHGTAWGSNYHPDSSGGHSTAYSNPVNDTFSITVNSDSTIVFDYIYHQILDYISTDTISKSMYFSDGYKDDITYYYIGDSILFRHKDVGVHTNVHVDLRTP